MGRKKQSKVEYSGITFDSPEEREMFWWCEEAQEHGLIREFKFQWPKLVVAERVKGRKPQYRDSAARQAPRIITLLREATYTVDFCIRGYDSNPVVPEYVDVKPGFTLRHDTARMFSLTRKWVYQKYDIVVHGLVPVDLFGRTFAPEKARFTTKTKKPRKRYAEFLTVEEFAKT